MRITVREEDLSIGVVGVPLLSIRYGDAARPAQPEAVRVSGVYDCEVVCIWRPQVVIHDALSDRVEDIVARFTEEGEGT